MSLTEMESYRELILENIEYDCLKQRFGTYREDLDEIVELLVETVCAKRKTTRIAGSDFPHEVVRSRFLKLDSSHIEFVMDCLQKEHHRGTEHETVPFDGAVQRAHHHEQPLHLTGQPRYVRRLLKAGRVLSARNCREKGICYETTACVYHRSLEQEPP